MSRPILERPDNPEAGIPACALWDHTQLGITTAVGAGVTRDSNILDLTGFRRYRLKIVQLTGAGPTAVSFLDLPFSRVVANAFETAVLAAAMATGVRTVFNFGEGTAILTNFMGVWGMLRLTNNGADAATYEIELFAQA